MSRHPSGDPWEGPLLAWLERPVHVRFDEHGHRHELPLDPTAGFSMAEVLEHGVGLSVERQGKRDQERAQQILRRAGWVREKNPRRVDGERVRLWLRGPGAGLVSGGGAGGGGGLAHVGGRSSIWGVHEGSMMWNAGSTS